MCREMTDVSSQEHDRTVDQDWSKRWCRRYSGAALMEFGGRSTSKHRHYQAVFRYEFRVRRFFVIVFSVRVRIHHRFFFSFSVSTTASKRGSVPAKSSSLRPLYFPRCQHCLSSPPIFTCSPITTEVQLEVLIN